MKIFKEFNIPRLVPTLHAGHSFGVHCWTETRRKIDYILLILCKP